ncbi:MAG TPA: hypothetical protein VEV81_10300, partial [Pyrinomonadaceae bacterium]|nr:hypothetical protein [Pyrinomonadaceae bacterium]
MRILFAQAGQNVLEGKGDAVRQTSFGQSKRLFGIRVESLLGHREELLATRRSVIKSAPLPLFVRFFLRELLQELVGQLWIVPPGNAQDNGAQVALLRAG